MVKGKQGQAFGSGHRSRSNDRSIITKQRIFDTVAIRKNSGSGATVLFQKDREKNGNQKKKHIDTDADFAEGR